MLRLSYSIPGHTKNGRRPRLYLLLRHWRGWRQRLVFVLHALRRFVNDAVNTGIFYFGKAADFVVVGNINHAVNHMH